ncbi:MAG TPA: hypothetical protein VFO36_10940, partial [Nitrospiraceae bacterium]|nr:hypothetical protein [Nitrospiraceae bacterium]
MLRHSCKQPCLSKWATLDQAGEGEALMQSSRIMAALALSAMAMSLVNCHRVMTFAVNVPGFFGAFDRRPDIPYGPHERARLDVYSPKGAKDRAVVIFWHGGLWVEGSRVDYRFV